MGTKIEPIIISNVVCPNCNGQLFGITDKTTGSFIIKIKCDICTEEISVSFDSGVAITSIVGE